MIESSDDEPFEDDSTSLWEEKAKVPQRLRTDDPRLQAQIITVKPTQDFRTHSIQAVSSINEAPPKAATASINEAPSKAAAPSREPPQEERPQNWPPKWPPHGEPSHDQPTMDIVKLGHKPSIVPKSWRNPRNPLISKETPTEEPVPETTEDPTFEPVEPTIKKLSAFFEQHPMPAVEEPNAPAAEEPKAPPAEPLKKEEESVPSIQKPMPPAHKFVENYEDESIPIGVASSSSSTKDVAKESDNDSKAPPPPSGPLPPTKDVVTDETQIVDEKDDENDKKQSAVPSEKKKKGKSDPIPIQEVTVTKRKTLATVVKSKTPPPRPGPRVREPRFRDPDGHRYNVDYTRPPPSFVQAYPSRRRRHDREEAMAAIAQAEGLELKGEYATTPDSSATSVTHPEPKGTRLHNVYMEQQVIVTDRPKIVPPTEPPTPKLPLAVNRERLLPPRECGGIEPQNQMYPGRRIAVDTPGFKPGEEIITVIEKQQESMKSQQPALVEREVILPGPPQEVKQEEDQEVKQDKHHELNQEEHQEVKQEEDQEVQQEEDQEVKQVEDQKRKQKDPPAESELNNSDSENHPFTHQAATAASGEVPSSKGGLDHDRDEKRMDQQKEEYKTQFMKYLEKEYRALQDKLTQLRKTTMATKKTLSTQTPQPLVQERLLQQLELERQREQLEYDALMKQVDELLIQATVTVATDRHDDMDQGFSTTKGRNAPEIDTESMTRTKSFLERSHQSSFSQHPGQQVSSTAAFQIQSEAYDRILRKWLSARAEQPRSHQTYDRILRQWLKENLKRETYPFDETPYDESHSVTPVTENILGDVVERLQKLENDVFQVPTGSISESRHKPDRGIAPATPEYIPCRRHEPEKVAVSATFRDSAQHQGLPRSSPTKVYDLPTREQSSTSSRLKCRRTIDAILHAEPTVSSRRSMGEHHHALASSLDGEERAPRPLRSTVSLSGDDRWRQVLSTSNSLQ